MSYENFVKVVDSDDEDEDEENEGGEVETKEKKRQQIRNKYRSLLEGIK